MGSRKWRNQFEDLTYNASNRLEGWIDDQKNKTDQQMFDDAYLSDENVDSYDNWIDNLDNSEELNRIDSRNRQVNSSNDRDLDPWV